MRALIAAVLALGGAPAGTTVSCASAPLLAYNATGAYALTYFGTPPVIRLGGLICSDLISASPGNRAVGEYIVLREAVHTALNNGNECEDDRVSLALLPRMRERFRWRPSDLRAVRLLGREMAALQGCPF
jgi:hypothetical protein